MIDNKKIKSDLTFFEISNALFSLKYIYSWILSLLFFLVIAFIYNQFNKTYYNGEVLISKVSPSASHEKQLTKLEYLKDNIIIKLETNKLINNRGDDFFISPGNETYKLVYDYLTSDIQLLAEYALRADLVNSLDEGYNFASSNISIEPVLSIEPSRNELNVMPVSKFRIAVSHENREKIEKFLFQILNDTNERVRTDINNSYYEFVNLISVIVESQNFALKNDYVIRKKRLIMRIKDAIQIAEQAGIQRPVIDGGDFIEVLGTSQGQFLLGYEILQNQLEILEAREDDEIYILDDFLSLKSIADIEEFLSIVTELPHQIENFKTINFSTDVINYEKFNDKIFTYFIAIILSILFSFAFIVLNIFYNQEKELLKLESRI